MWALRLALCVAVSAVGAALTSVILDGGFLLGVAWGTLAAGYWIYWEDQIQRKRELRKSITARLHDLEKFQ